MKHGIGIIKEIDALGRIVIPKELRSLFRFGDEVEIVITEQGLLLRNPEYRLVRRPTTHPSVSTEGKDNAKSR